MRKRILIPLVAAGAFTSVAGVLTGFFFIGQHGINKLIASCNEGKDDSCIELANSFGETFFGREKVTNPAF